MTYDTWEFYWTLVPQSGCGTFEQEMITLQDFCALYYGIYSVTWL